MVKEAVPAVETAARNAYTAELLTGIAAGGPRSAMLGKWSAQAGVDTVHMAQRVAQFAPSLANGAELSGFAKVMVSLGALGAEPNNYAKIIWLAGRFTTPITDLSCFGTLANSALGVAGISAGVGAATGIAATVVGGVELDWGKDPSSSSTSRPSTTGTAPIYAHRPEAEPMTFQVPRQVTGYSVVLPPGWRRIPVWHGTTSAIKEIADEVLAGIPAGRARESAALFRTQIDCRLDELAKQARSLGGVDIYLPVSYVHGTAIPASFNVSEGTPPAAGITDSGQVAGYLASALPGASPVMVDGCAGARVESTAPAENILGIEAASRRVDYALPVPGQPGQWLTVTFATAGDGDPKGEFANLLVELFDSIMLTFRWVTAHATADGA